MFLGIVYVILVLAATWRDCVLRGPRLLVWNALMALALAVWAAVKV